MYELRYLPGAERFFKKLKEKGLKDAFRKALEAIAQDPYTGESKTGDLSGRTGGINLYGKAETGRKPFFSPGCGFLLRQKGEDPQGTLWG